MKKLIGRESIKKYETELKEYLSDIFEEGLITLYVKKVDDNNYCYSLSLFIYPSFTPEFNCIIPEKFLHISIDENCEALLFIIESNDTIKKYVRKQYFHYKMKGETNNT